MVCSWEMLVGFSTRIVCTLVNDVVLITQRFAGQPWRVLLMLLHSEVRDERLDLVWLARWSFLVFIAHLRLSNLALAYFCIVKLQTWLLVLVDISIDSLEVNNSILHIHYSPVIFFHFRLLFFHNVYIHLLQVNFIKATVCVRCKSVRRFEFNLRSWTFFKISW